MADLLQHPQRPQLGNARPASSHRPADNTLDFWLRRPLDARRQLTISIFEKIDTYYRLLLENDTDYQFQGALIPPMMNAIANVSNRSQLRAPGPGPLSLPDFSIVRLIAAGPPTNPNLRRSKE